MYMGSQFLFAHASPVEGIARIWDFGDTLTEFNASLTPEQADFFAMRADWAAVGHDLRVAMGKCKAEKK